MASSEDTSVFEPAVPIATDDSADSADETKQWESIARQALTYILYGAKADLERDVYALERGLRESDEKELTADDVREFRQSLYELQRQVEEQVVPVVDGVEPYENAVQNVNYGHLAEALGVTFGELETARELQSGDNGPESEE